MKYKLFIILLLVLCSCSAPLRPISSTVFESCELFTWSVDKVQIIWFYPDTSSYTSALLNNATFNIKDDSGNIQSVETKLWRRYYNIIIMEYPYNFFKHYWSLSNLKCHAYYMGWAVETPVNPSIWTEDFRYVLYLPSVQRRSR